MAASSDRGLREANRLSWNTATRAHNSHKQDQASFFRAAAAPCAREELRLLGDIVGLRVVHLL